MSLKVGELFVTFRTNLAQFVSDMDTAQAKSTAFGAAVGTVVGNLATQGFEVLGRKALEAGESIAESLSHAIEFGEQMSLAAQKTGLTVESLSALSYAAKLSNTNFEALQTGLERFGKSVAIAQQGGDGAKNILQALNSVGLGLADLAEPMDVLFQKFARNLSALPEGPQRINAAVQLMGRSGAELIPVLDSVGNNMDGITAKARDAGVALTTNLADAAKQAADKAKELSEKWAGLKLRLGEALIPAATSVLDFLDRMIDKVGKLGDKLGPVGERWSLLASGFGPLAQAAGGLLGSTAASLGLVPETIAPAPPPITIHPEVPGFALAGPPIDTKALEDAAKKAEALRVEFQKSLAPADDLAAKIKILRDAHFSDDQILAVYGKDIEKAAEAQREHGLAIPPVIESLNAMQASQARYVADAQDYLNLKFNSALAESREAAALKELTAEMDSYLISQESATVASRQFNEIFADSPLLKISSSAADATALTDKAFHDLGLKSGFELSGIAEEAKKSFSIVAGSGEAGALQVQQAWVKTQEAIRDAARAGYGAWTTEQDKALKDGQRKLSDMEAQVKGTGDAWKEMGRVAKSAVDSFNDGFAAAITSGGGFKSVLASLGVELEKLIIKFTLLIPLEKEMAAVFSSSGSGGGFWGTIFGGIKNLFGGASSAISGFPVNFDQLTGSITVPGFAGGGDVSGGPIMVGEEGPELFIPKSSGTVVPNSIMNSPSSNSQVVFNIDARGAQPGVEKQIRAAVQLAMAQFVPIAVQQSVMFNRELAARRAGA